MTPIPPPDAVACFTAWLLPMVMFILGSIPNCKKQSSAMDLVAEPFSRIISPSELASLMVALVPKWEAFSGDVTKKVTVEGEGIAVSKGAREAIEKAGGKVVEAGAKAEAKPAKKAKADPKKKAAPKKEAKAEEAKDEASSEDSTDAEEQTEDKKDEE